MSDNGDSGEGGGGGGGGLKTFLLIVVAIVAGFWAIKLTAWLVKTALIVAAAGAAGYVGYTLIKGRLGAEATEEPEQIEQEPRLLTAEPAEEAPAEDLAADIDAALEELKRRMREE